MRESEFQKNFIGKVKILFPDSIIVKNDPCYKQGIPDWSVLEGDKYALLEIKRSYNARHRPNQEYYINKANKNGGLGRFVYPENEDEVINDLKNYFNK